MIVASSVVHGIVHALSFAGGMTWEILWAPILSASPSPASSSAVVSKREMRRLMPPKTLLAASGVGAASSSCSYASVALARSLPVQEGGGLHRGNGLRVLVAAGLIVEFLFQSLGLE